MNGIDLVLRFLQSTGKFMAQPLARHGVNIPIGLACGRLQIFAGAATGVENVAIGIGQYCRRGEMLQQQLVCQRFQIGDGVGSAVHVLGLGCHWKIFCREINFIDRQKVFNTLINP